MGNRAVLFTIYNRPEYLAPVLESWDRVRNLADWTIQFRFEPSNRLHEVSDLVEQFVRRNALTKVERMVHPERLGVLLCPWVGFEDLFSRHDFVVRAEDDLLVSDDFLTFFEHADRVYARNRSIGAVCAASQHGTGVPREVYRETSFSPWGWGTWRDRWTGLIGPTWDKNYSTFNGYPGHQSGWDWNLNTRIFPEHCMYTIYPFSSRVQNIGIHGTHGTAENHKPLPTFREEYGEVRYVEVAA